VAIDASVRIRSIVPAWSDRLRWTSLHTLFGGRVGRSQHVDRVELARRRFRWLTAFSLWAAGWRFSRRQLLRGRRDHVYEAALYRLREQDFGELRHHGGISPAWAGGPGLV
jgi:hypothetical protein